MEGGAEDEEGKEEAHAPNQAELPGSTAAPEKIKKKRGRKPKSFYIEQQKEQERLARESADMRMQEMQEAENEEEVVLRQDEYKQHPMFARLSLYTEELKDYIIEKRRLNEELLAQKELEKKELLN